MCVNLAIYIKLINVSYQIYQRCSCLPIKPKTVSKTMNKIDKFMNMKILNFLAYH